MWSNGPLFNLGKLKHLDLVDRWGLHTKLATKWVPWRFGCSTGATDRPCWGSGLATGGSWTKSLATILGDICKKHDGNFWRTRFWEIEVYLSSRFLPYFPFGIPWFEQITAGHAVRTTSPRLTSPHLTLSNTTRALGFLTLLKRKKTAPGMNLIFGYAKKLTTITHTPS